MLKKSRIKANITIGLKKTMKFQRKNKLVTAKCNVCPIGNVAWDAFVCLFYESRIFDFKPYFDLLFKVKSTGRMHSVYVIPDVDVMV